MDGITNLYLFLVTALVVNMTPGADSLYMLNHAAKNGWKGGVAAAAGIHGGVLCHLLAAAFGLAAVIATNEWLFDLIRWCGAAYLVWMGVGMILRRNTTPSGTEAAIQSASGIVLQGWLTNVLNPKVALFFVALLPQFVVAGHNQLLMPMLLLGLMFVATSLVWTSIMIVTTRLVLRRWQPGAMAGRVANVFAGILMAALGIRLGVSQGG